MLSVTDKLKLITEGYSIDDINKGQINFSTLLPESYNPANQIGMILESINVDFEFMYETNVIYLQESVLDTIKEKIRKFISWISEKIMNIIRWIKQKFFKKTTEISTTATNVTKKVNSGELSDKINAIKTGDVQKYKETKVKHNPTTGKIDLDIKELRGSFVDPEAFDKFVADHINTGTEQVAATSEIPDKQILKLRIKQKIVDNSVPNIAEIASNIVRIVNTSLGNVENFRVAIVRGTSNVHLNGEDTVKDLLINLGTANKISGMKHLNSYVLGETTEVELTMNDVVKAAHLLEKFQKEGEQIFNAYNNMKSLLDRWKDESIAIIDKYQDSPEVRPETINRRVQQMMQLITASVTILNTLLALKSEGLTDCEVILKTLDSI